MSALGILSISPSACIQDQGRVGFLRYGVTSSGAMDMFALAEGQALLGNTPDAAAIEFAEFGGRFKATGPLAVATSGGVMALKLNDIPVGWRQVLALRVGDILDVGASIEGVYGYLHVAGGFQTERMLGARATHLRAGFGHVLAAGQMLQVGAPDRSVAINGLPRPDYFDRRHLRILWGPQSQYFDAAEREKFTMARFTISKMRDRMGIQINPDCGPIHAAAGLSIASDSINAGDIQVTGDGTPAILLADRGPSGGYPRIGTLVTADFGALAQIPTGESFTIEVIERAEAVVLLEKYRNKNKVLSASLRPMLRDPRDIGDLLAYNLISGVTTGASDDES
ncbi:MAG: biotin-dependent carboxyltransferase family protein [Alphaproteobacteria bacterium]|nr:biotin-dependent carboxyltransferase family protein [Alphaproteobacteria bacterium]